MGENVIGKYGYGLSRNSNGVFLVELLSELNLFLANTAFKHAVKHRYTWNRQRTTDGITKKYKSQIDFLICTQNTKSTIQNARSYGGTMTTSYGAFFNIQTTGEISPAGPIPSPVVTGKIRKIPQLFGPTR